MIWDKWLGSHKTPEEKAAAKVASIEGGERVRNAVAEAKSKRKKRSLEKMIIAVTDKAYLTALLGACFVAYMLDAIFFFQQTTLLWLSLLLCLFGIVIRTIAITGGVVLQAAEEEETKKPADAGAEKQHWLMRKLSAAGRILGRFSLARTTMRTVTIFCWIACAFASVSFFASGQEMRNFAQDSIEAVETTTVESKQGQIAILQKEIEALDKDKVDIRADRDRLIAGARASLTETSTDGSSDNDDVVESERTIARYNTSAEASLAIKDGVIETKRQAIRDLEQGKEVARVGAEEQKAETPPFLAVYVFLARLTGFLTENVTTWVSLFFAIVLELLVDTGLQNYFGMRKKHAKRQRAIEARELLEDAEWEVNRFNMIQAANLHKAKAQALAFEATALQERELAEIKLRAERQMAQTEAARLNVPWVDPQFDLNLKMRLAQAELDEKAAKVEFDIKEAAARAEALRNPPPPPPPPPAPPPPDPKDWRLEIGPDGLNHYQRMQQKSEQSKKFGNDMPDIKTKLKVKTEDWRTRFAA